MSLLIKGMDMEMPQNCCECPLNMVLCNHGYKYLYYHPELYDKRADDCPIMEVPPAIAETQQHAWWVTMQDADGRYYCCSECGEELDRFWTFIKDIKTYPVKESINKTPYCPHCGAKMDVIT